MNEMTELSARFFIKSANANATPSEFVQTKSQELNVCVNGTEFELMLKHLARSYIASSYQAAELFLSEFRREHSTLTMLPWIGDRKGVTQIELTLENISGKQPEKNREIIGKELLDAFDYYRVIRNWVTHPKTISIAAPNASYQAISSSIEALRRDFNKLNAPNPPSELKFDDFILFTRVIKTIAERLCLISKPNIDDFIKNRFIESEAANDFRRFINNKERCINSIANHLRTEHGLHLDYSLELATHVHGLLAQR